MTKSKKLGFVAAKPIPQVLININSFTLGARSVDPSITTQVIFTGDWSMPVKEAEATNSLADQGVDVVTCHVDGPKVVIETAERRGIYTCGYHANQAPLAPKGYLTGAEWNWATVYKMFVDGGAGRRAAAELRARRARGGLRQDVAVRRRRDSEAARQHADAVKAEMLKGGYAVFKGPLKDNKGSPVIAVRHRLSRRRRSSSRR